MIFGIGTDIVAIARLQRLVERHSPASVRRLLAPFEWSDYESAADKGRFLAKRFAVKEAFAKACGTGLRTPLSLQRIGLEHDALGKPVLRLADEARDWLDGRLGQWSVHVSVSDEQEMAVAFVVLEAGPVLQRAAGVAA